MKTTIQLTTEQIETITKVEKDLLLVNKTKAIEAIEKKYNEDVIKLTNKYKNYTIDISNDVETPKRTVVKLSDETLTRFFNDGYTIKEIAEITSKKELNVRVQLKRLGLKLKDRIITPQQEESKRVNKLL